MKKKTKLKFNKKKLLVIDEMETPKIKGGITGAICTTSLITITRTLDPHACGITIECQR